jgi:Winged helix DNA-binding domain
MGTTIATETVGVGRVAAPLPDAATPAPVRFLPKWDNMLLALADRTRVHPEQYRKTVIRMNGDVAQTFLVDGFVAGIWRVEEAASCSIRSRRCHARFGASSRTKPHAWRRSSPTDPLQPAGLHRRQRSQVA